LLFQQSSILQILSNNCGGWVKDIAGRESGPSILYVSHHIEEILPVFTHALLLRRGEAHSQGRTREVLTRKNLTDFFEKTIDVRWSKARVLVRMIP
jgi:iron complex transport system ATP-binding protein